MIKIIGSLLVCFFLYSGLQGQDIVDFLKEKSSNAIVVNDYTEFIIESAETSQLIRKYEVIVKNKRGKDFLQVPIYYDRFQEVDDAEVLVSSLLGEEINRFKLKDFDDLGLGLSDVASDGRLKLLEINVSSFPVKVNVFYKLNKKESLHYPSWTPQDDEKVRILSSELVVRNFSGSPIRYRGVLIDEPEISTVENGEVFTWSLKDLEPFEYERFNNSIEDYAPIVYIAPSSFSMEGRPGDMSSWHSFGKWQYDLIQEANQMNMSGLDELDKKVAMAQSKEEIVAMVYDYLQTNTRYVSIQLGIGGWKPFSPSFVQEKRYGDCKALSFYTLALLKRYDIEGIYTLIRAGKYQREVQEDFSNAYFNHAILTVPIEQDTIFLECTSQTKPFGYLGTFTSDRNALLITEEGGKLIHTKKYTEEENLQKSVVNVTMDANGNSMVQMQRNYSGLEIDNYDFRFLYLKEEKEKREWLIDNHNFGNIELNSFELLELKEGTVPTGGFTCNFLNKKDARKMGSRLFINPSNYTNNYISKLSSHDRTKPIRVKYGFMQQDSIIFQIPEVYITEKGLDDVLLETPFGTYQRNLVRDENGLFYSRKFVLKSGVYPVEEYEAFRSFINDVERYDKEVFVVVNKT